MHLFSPFNSPDWRCKKFPTLTKTPKADSGNYRWLRMKDQNIPTTAKAEASTWIEFRPPFLYLLQRKIENRALQITPIPGKSPGLMDGGGGQNPTKPHLLGPSTPKFHPAISKPSHSQSVPRSKSPRNFRTKEKFSSYPFRFRRSVPLPISNVPQVWFNFKDGR
ncbi:predicted protein [Histoplasma capsulatum var. duboisii H88]|uniref:Predicted protein n=1 Tax=Ajellomyces capsulatus (strain H88) TaxID=544711 RepID=F0UBB3_AJEC8|nr:predicted protein [Histoplasma capsulatum var. duboisii H88]